MRLEQPQDSFGVTKYLVACKKYRIFQFTVSNFQTIEIIGMKIFSIRVANGFMILFILYDGSKFKGTITTVFPLLQVCACAVYKKNLHTTKIKILSQLLNKCQNIGLVNSLFLFNLHKYDLYMYHAYNTTN